MRLPHKSGTGPLLGGAALGAALTAAGWWWDARRRRRETARMRRTQVDLLLNVLSAGDEFTAQHSRRVADLTDALADSFGLARKERARLRIASLLHDMGKIDDQFFHIIHSRDRLTEEQRREIRQHPYESAHILQPLERTQPGIMRIVASHHECWDGKGYPRGLSGEEIPLEARIISVADVFDALTQPRAYRDPLSPEEALQVIRGGVGEKFDPEVAARLERPEVLRRWMATAERGRARARTREEALRELSA